MAIDVLIVGGGPAGLSAAIVLGRCHRRVLICDDGKPRNRHSHAIHGLLGQEGTAPSAFARAGANELKKYPSVSYRQTRVLEISSASDGFEFRCEDGTPGTAAKILLASGITDELPDIAGLDAFYGVSVHHCLYCDGFEYEGKSAAAYGNGDKGAELAIMMKHWITDVVACSDGTEVSDPIKRKLDARNIPLRPDRISALHGTNGHLERIDFETGAPLPVSAMFFATGCHQSSDLSARLGCERNGKGGVITDPDTEETSVPGVYVAGDVSRDVLMVSVAIAEGAKAAVAINKGFLRRDGFCD